MCLFLFYTLEQIKSWTILIFFFFFPDESMFLLTGEKSFFFFTIRILAFKEEKGNNKNKSLAKYFLYFLNIEDKSFKPENDPV